MPVAAAGVVSLFTGAAFGGGMAGAVAAFAARSALSFGISKLTGALDRPDSSAGGIKTSITVAGEQHPQTAVFGRYATAGAAACPPYVWDYDDGGEYLTYVITVSDIPVEGLESLIVDGKPCSISETGQHSQYGKRILDPHGRFDGHAWVRFHDGSQTQADEFLVNAFSTHSSRPWDETMILRGVAYAVLTFRYNQERFTGLPECKFVVKGARLYDPRTDSLVYTTNPIVMSFNIIRGITLPGTSGTWGINAPASALPLARWIAAMNACDVLVNGQPRYRAGTEFSFSDEPLSVLEEILNSCGGDIADVGGVYNVSVGSPGVAVASITDEDVIISDDREFSVHEGLAKVFNGVNATYPDPSQLWEQREAVPFKNPAWVAQDDGREIPASITFSAVPYPQQVRRLTRELAADNRRQRRHVITVGPWALVLMPLQTIAWTSPNNGYSAKLFEITSIIVKPDSLNCILALRERDPNDYSFDIISDTTLPSAPSPISEDQVILGLTGFIAEGTAIVGADGQPRRPAIRLSWASGVPYASISYRIRLKETLDIALRGSIIDVAGGTNVLSAGILPDTDYECQARGVVRGRRSDWSAWQSIRTPGVFMSDADFENGVRSLFEDAGMRAIEYMPTLPVNGGVVGRTVFNTTDKKLYRWTGMDWVSVVDQALTGALSETHFAQGITVPRVVAVLPAQAADGSLAVLEGDGKLYRRVNGVWTAAVPAIDVAGQLTSGQIESIVASKVSGQLTSAQIESVVASKISGQITAAQIAAIEAGKISGQLTSGQIESIVASKVSGQITSAQIEKLVASKIDGQITNEQIASLAAAKLAGQITSVQISDNAISAPKIAAGAIVADKIAAGSIVASKLAIGDAMNLVSDPEYQDVSSSWSTGAFMTFGVASEQGTQTYGQSTVLMVRNIETGPAGWTQVLRSRPFSVQGGTDLFAELGMWSNRNAFVIIRVGFYSDAAATAYIGQITLVTGSLAGIGNRILSASGTVPSNALSASADIYVDRSITVGGNVSDFNIGRFYVSRKNAGELIVDGAITADKIAANAITAAKISAGAVGANEIAAGSIFASKIAAGAVNADKIAANAITADKIAANTIVASKIAVIDLSNMLPEGDFSEGGSNWAVQGGGTANVFDISRTTFAKFMLRLDPSGSGTGYTGIVSKNIPVSPGRVYHLGANIFSNGAHFSIFRINWMDSFGVSISQSNVAANANFDWGYYSANLTAPAGASFAAVALYLRNDAGSSAYIQMANVVVRPAASAELIVDGAITADKVAANAITAVKISAGSITGDRLAVNAITAREIATSTITATQIAAGTITGDKVAANAITAREVAAGSITANEIAANTITAAKISAGAIGANQIAANAITAAKIAADTITGNEIRANTITGGLLAAAGIITSAAQINNAVITSAKIADAAITSAKIQDLTVGSIKLVNGSVTRQWTAEGERNLSLSFTLEYPSRVIIGYTYQPTESQLFNGRTWRYGHTLRVNGAVRAFTGSLFIPNADTNTDSSRQLKMGEAFAMNLPAGDHIIAVNNQYGATNATIYVFAGQK